ncbi:MAG: EI24 domain-containing protein [Flavobacteriaceae bacterium]|nr:EI24 domain-containing protein [Flavobacteriaceae bacterium]
MIKNILTGLKAYADSFGLISKLRLWKYFVIPILISLATAMIIGASAYAFSDNITDYLTGLIPGWDPPNWVRSIEIFLIGLIIVAVGLILYKHIVMALSAPFMSPVSEKIEHHYLGEKHSHHRVTNFSQQLWRGIRINVRNLAKELLLTVPILLMGFIPVIGIFSTVLLFFVQAYYAGFGNMDYTLERHFSYKESIQFVSKRKGLAIGNGIIFMLLLLIPVIGIIFVLPVSVVSATKVTINELHPGS